MYPMALICALPLSVCKTASFPHEFESSCFPPVPKPILESQLTQLSSLLPIIPILAFANLILVETTLNPSLLQFNCREAFIPISDFHVSRPSEVARYSPWVVDQSAYRGRSWRKVFSSRLVTSFLVSQSHSCQQPLHRSLCPSRNGNRNWRYAEITIKAQGH